MRFAGSQSHKRKFQRVLIVSLVLIYSSLSNSYALFSRLHPNRLALL